MCTPDGFHHFHVLGQRCWVHRFPCRFFRWRYQYARSPISPALKSDEYRIVLTWGERPWDLDSHLYVTKQGEESYHVWYWNMVHYEDGEIVAQLDIDDTWSEGPETITVTVVVDKELSYHYYVQDYTNGSNSSSTELSLSGASVQVYNGERLIKSYTVPMNEKGTRWNVFEIMNGKLVDINTIN